MGTLDLLHLIEKVFTQPQLLP